jgi:hypothetical protein
MAAKRLFCGSYCMHVASEVEIDVFHRNDLGAAASAIVSEHWPKRRFAQSYDRFFSNLSKCLDSGEFYVLMLHKWTFFPTEKSNIRENLDFS